MLGLMRAVSVGPPVESVTSLRWIDFGRLSSCETLIVLKPPDLGEDISDSWIKVKSPPSFSPLNIDSAVFWTNTFYFFLSLPGSTLRIEERSLCRFLSVATFKITSSLLVTEAASRSILRLLVIISGSGKLAIL